MDVEAQGARRHVRRRRDAARAAAEAARVLPAADPAAAALGARQLPLPLRPCRSAHALPARRRRVAGAHRPPTGARAAGGGRRALLARVRLCVDRRVRAALHHRHLLVVPPRPQPRQDGALHGRPAPLPASVRRLRRRRRRADVALRRGGLLAAHRPRLPRVPVDQVLAEWQPVRRRAPLALHHADRPRPRRRRARRHPRRLRLGHLGRTPHADGHARAREALLCAALPAAGGGDARGDRHAARDQARPLRAHDAL